MKHIKLFLYALAFPLLLASCGGSDDDGDGNGGGNTTSNNVNANVVTSEKAVSRLEFPKVKGGTSIVIVHTTSDKYDKDGINYSVEWDCGKKSQRWTCYQMYKGYGGNAGYYGSFEEDPDCPYYARFPDTYSYYRGSGFTRGHICPSADRQYSSLANHQTFYYTNMQPQYYNFNAGENYKGVWVRMENKVRTWANNSTKDTNNKSVPDTLYVCKGGTIDNEKQILQRIKGELIVPKYFFMAILCKTPKGYKALGFWAEHKNIVETDELKNYVVNIDELERLTGIDFFCNLPDDTENKVESLNKENVARAWGLQ